MKNYEIDYKNITVAQIFGTPENTINIPAGVDFESHGLDLELKVKGIDNSKIGILPEVGTIEVSVEDARICIKDVTFEKLEIDAKGMITVCIENSRGDIDINMIGGQATVVLITDADYKYRVEGNNKVIGNIDGENGTYTLEANGKNCTVVVFK